MREASPTPGLRGSRAARIGVSPLSSTLGFLLGWDMRVGFISDIHGNLRALDAVLADLERHDVDRIVCLGDICFGPQAHECLDRVRELGCPVILGDWDSWSIDGFPPADDPVGIMLYEIGRWWAGQLTDDDKAFVRTFVSTLEVPLDNGTTALCYHGSPRS